MRLKGLGDFEMTRAGVVLNTDLQEGVPGKMSLQHTKGLASYWFYDPEVLDITGQVPVRVFLKF